MRLFAKKEPIVPRLPEPKLVHPMELLEAETGPVTYTFYARGNKSGKDYRLTTSGQCYGFCIGFDWMNAALPSSAKALAIKALLEADEKLFLHVANHGGRST